jgi:hypothetical protein
MEGNWKKKGFIICIFNVSIICIMNSETIITDSVFGEIFYIIEVTENKNE